MKRGDVYWASLSPRSGSEQTGCRPVIILSHDAFNQIPNWRSIIVIPLSTSTTQTRRGPTVVAVKAGIAGLLDDCSVLCHQITTLDRAKLTDKIGELPLDILGLVEQALLAAVGVGKV